MIRNLIQHVVIEEDFGIEYPCRVFKTEGEVVRHIVVARIQVADDLIILQDGRVLRDAVLEEEDENGASAYHYYEGVTFDFHKKVKNRQDIMFMAWGHGKSASQVFDGVWF